MTLLEQIIEAMATHKGAAHVDDIAQLLLQAYPNHPVPADKLSAKVSAVLSADARKPASKASFAKVKNKKGGYRRGMYRLKRKPVVTPNPTLAPAVSTQHTGKAGEFSVMSELLFYGFNVSSMAVDDGIDIITSKNNHYFQIQVKTANGSESNVYSFSIKRSSFLAKESFSTFYIFVVRDIDSHRYSNDYIIFPCNQIKQFIEVGLIKDAASLSVRVHKDKRGRFILNGKQDITISVNTFSQLV